MNTYMINRKIAMSAMSILTALGMTAGATFAFFSDTATSTANTFATGSFDLRLSDDNETVQDSIAGTFNSSIMAPGANPVTATIQLRNSGTVAGSNVHLKATNTETDTTPAQDIGAMSSFLQLTSASYDGGDILPLIIDLNGNGIKDLNDLQLAPGDGPEIGTLSNLNTDHPLTMTVQLHSGANNTYIGDSVSTVLSATLHQDASQ